MKTGSKIIISLAAAIAAGLLSLFSHVLLLPVIALAAYMGAEWGWAYLAPTLAAIAGALLAAFELDASLIVILVMFISAAVLLTVYAGRRLPHRYALLILSALFCVGTYLSVSIVPMLEGRPPYADAVELWEKSYSQSISGLLPNSSETAAAFSAAIPTVLMPSCLLAGELAGLALIFLLRLWHRFFKTAPAPMAKLRDWRLPSNSLLGALMLLLAIGACYLFRVAQANAIALSLGAIIVTMFSVQGFAFITFVLQVSEAPRGLGIFMWVSLILLFPYSLLVLTFIGVREQIRSRRRLITRKLREAERMSKAERRAEELAKYGYIRDEKKGGSGESGPEDDKED